MKNLQNTIQERFLAEVKRLKFKFPVAKISKGTDYKAPIVSEYLSGKKMVSDKFLQTFCEVYKIDYEDLIKESENIDKPKSEKGKRRIPILGEAIAGTDMEIVVTEGDQHNDYIDVGELLSDSEAAFTVYGNSMTPAYPPGCLIGIKRNMDNFIQPGETYMLLTKSNRVFKRLFYNKDKTGYLCKSDNELKYESGELHGQPYYPIFEVPFESVISVFDVTGMIKRNRNSAVMQRQK